MKHKQTFDKADYCDGDMALYGFVPFRYSTKFIRQELTSAIARLNRTPKTRQRSNRYEFRKYA